MSEENSDSTRNNHFRFPCEQMEYTRIVGSLLPAILGEIFTELGFRVNVNHQQANGVDMKVFLRDTLVLVVEVQNWSIGSRLTYKRRGNIIRNLSEFDCNKLLIHTIPLSDLSGLRENGIDIIELGYQVLPETFYNHYLQREQVERRKALSDSTMREIRAKILEYVDQKLFGYMYLRFLF